MKQAANTERQKGMCPTSHTWWPRSRTYGLPWESPACYHGKPAFVYTSISTFFLSTCCSTFISGLLWFWPLALCNMTAILLFGAFFPFYPVFCSITGQKYHKLVRMEVFLDIELLQSLEHTERSQESNQIWRASSRILLVDFCCPQLLTGVLQSFSEQWL